MSTCPEKDIHSVYLDGELPEQFRSAYEAHLASCASCRTELEKLRQVHALFAKDAAETRLDTVFMEQSFARLQTKLRYAATVQKAAPAKNVLSFPAVRMTLSAAAAAAVFAVIFTPLYLRSAQNSGSQNELTAIANAELEPLSEKKVIIDGNISHKDLSSLAIAETESKSKPQPAEQRTVRASATVSNSVAARSMRRAFTSVDVFKPNGVDAASSLPLKIETPLPLYGGESR